MLQDLTEHDHTIVYRQGQRFVQQLEHVNMANVADREQPVIKEGGVYLLAGGAGYIGLNIAKYLAKRARVVLVLINRTPLPERDKWSQVLAAGQPQDTIFRRIQGIAEIEKLGSEVMYVAADIGDRRAMAQVIENVLRRYGRINGVINATMELQRQTIEELSQEHFAHSLFNRLRGAYVLDQATRREKLDFFIIISSLSSLFGGIGQADDVSANRFLDAYGSWMEHTGQEVSVFSLPGILEQRSPSRTVAQRILPAISSAEFLELFALLICKKTGFVLIEDFDFQEIRQVLPALKVHFSPDLLAVKSTATQQPIEDSPANRQLNSRGLTEQIAGVWSKVLGYPEISIHENFFDLGGDSLIAMRVVEKLQEVFGSSVAIADLFKHPTIAALADCIEQRIASSRVANELPRESPEKKVYSQPPDEQRELGKQPVCVAEPKDAPLSFFQEKLWFLEQLMPGTTVNNVALAYRLKGPLDLSLVARCISELVQRHEILRTTFVFDGESPMQRIMPELAPALEIVNLQLLAAQEQEAKVRQFATDTLFQPFDLAHGPLLRGKLITLHEQEHVIALALHHIVFDGWSMGIFLAELAALYTAFSQGHPSPLPPLPFQYAGFARAQRQQLHGQAFDELVAFWRRRLAGARATELPADYPRTQQLSLRSNTQPIIVPFTVVKKLQGVSQQEQSTLFVTLLAAFFALLRLYTQQEDLVIGAISANRSGAGTNKLIGVFVNTLIMRVNCTGISSFRDLIRRVRQVVLEASEHQALTFEQILDAIDPHNPLVTPLIRIVFNFYTNPLHEVNFLGLPMMPIELEKKEERYDISLEISDDGEQGLNGFISYNASLFKPTTIARIAKQLETFLHNVASEPDMSV